MGMITWRCWKANVRGRVTVGWLFYLGGCYGASVKGVSWSYRWDLVYTFGEKLCRRYYLPGEQAGCPVVFLLLEILAGYQISFGGCAKNHLAGHSGALLYLTLLSGCCSKGHPAGHSFALVLLTLLSGCCSKNHLAGQCVSLALA